MGGVPDVPKPRSTHDILTAHFVQHPDWVPTSSSASNLFGDILPPRPGHRRSNRLAPGGNINPEREYPSMFGRYTAPPPTFRRPGHRYPIAQIWTVR